MDEPENRQVDTEDDKKSETEENLNADENELHDESARTVVLQEKFKDSIGITVTRATVSKLSNPELLDSVLNENAYYRSNPQLEQRPDTWPISSTSNRMSLKIVKESPTPSRMSIAEDEKNMEHVIMKENIWDDLYPKESRNKFIQKLIDKMILKSKKFPKIKEELELKLKSITSLSVFKFDEAFIELFLSELAIRKKITEKDSKSFRKLVQEYLIDAGPEFNAISGDFKKFINSCLLHLVENKQCQPLCLKRFLDWYFFKLVHSFDFIKDEWNKWKEDMEKPFDDKIKIYINEALIQACNVDNYEMVFEFLNKGFQIYDKFAKLVSDSFPYPSFCFSQLQRWMDRVTCV